MYQFLVFSLVLALLQSTFVVGQFYYKEIQRFVLIPEASACIQNQTDTIFCSVHSLRGVSIQTSCVNVNGIRIVGEYDTLRIICESTEAIDFRYYGTQPTEAIRVEWFKKVLPATNRSIAAFGVDVQIKSVNALHTQYSAKYGTVSKHDYPRSGKYVFKGIFKEDIEFNMFLYLEDSGNPAFLVNSQSRINYIDGNLTMPCILSHYGKNVSTDFTNLDGVTTNLDFEISSDGTQTLTRGIPEDELVSFHGTYTCRYGNLGEAEHDQLILQYPDNSSHRFGLDGSVASKRGPSIRYYMKDDQDKLEIQIGCKVHELNAPTQLNAIEVENFAMMNLKREFTFPNYVNRSYTALSVSTAGELSFEIRLQKKFYTRYGGVTYCKSGQNMEIVEFAVPFVGEVSKREFDAEWPSFDRTKSDIHIHYDIGIHSRNIGDGIYAQTKLTFRCQFIVAIVVKPCIWTSIWLNGSRIEERIDYNWTGELEDSSYFTRVIDPEMVGIECSATFYYANFWRDISLPFEVKSGAPPVIQEPAGDLVLRIGAINQGLTCTATGRPPPILEWHKGGSQLFAALTTNGTLLHQIQKVERSNAGEYTCKAENIYGKDEKTFKYRVEGDESSGNVGFLVGIPITVFILTAVAAVVYIKFFRTEPVGLTRAEVEEFLAGEKNTARNSSAYAHEFAHLTPYDKNFELNDNKYQIDTEDILGSGAYGIVYRGIVDGRSVAVKTTKKNSDKAYLKALLSELKIMIYLGHHENIVELVGASTKNLDKGTVYVFVPFCAMGNLENFLRSNRHLYEEAADMVYRNMDSGVFNFNDLVAWSMQIADGMEYMASRKVIHGDLAARNILLTEHKQARITDFGLSRQLYGYASYVKKHQEPLPWRWMSLESLRDLSFSTLSDVWSYGILLWEIFSLGEVPYPGMAWTLDFVDELENGLRMARPKRTPDYIYNNVLYLCWHKIPTERPTFSEIRQIFKSYREIRITKSNSEGTDGHDKNCGRIKPEQRKGQNEYTNNVLLMPETFP